MPCLSEESCGFQLPIGAHDRSLTDTEQCRDSLEAGIASLRSPVEVIEKNHRHTTVVRCESRR
jgi:hypothetical protein